MAPQDWTELVLHLAAPWQPDWVAIEFEDRQITIKQLSVAMCRAAGRLADGQGIVAVCEDDPIDHAIGMLGAVAAGRTALSFDSRQPCGLLETVIHQAQAKTLIGREVAGVERISQEDLEYGSPITPKPHPPGAVGSILLTSGSTGRPKLAQRQRSADLHGAMCLRLSGFPLLPGDRHWLCVPYAGAPFGGLLMGALLSRATVVVAPFQRDAVDVFLREQRISSTYLVPTMLRLARQYDGMEGPGWKALRALGTGGEKLDDATAQLLLDRFPGRVFCAYGMTESPRPTQATFEEMTARPGTVGRTIPFRQIRVVGQGTDEDVPVGEEGEVLVSGPDLFYGYLGHNPVGTWYRTGDLGRFDDDEYLYITGRASSVVQVGGNRVDTEEVSSALRAHPEVAQAAVIPVEDATWTTRLVGFVVPQSDSQITGEDLRSWLKERYAAYKVPRTIDLLTELPVDSSGKLSLQTLNALAKAQPLP